MVAPYRYYHNAYQLHTIINMNDGIIYKVYVLFEKLCSQKKM